MARPPGDRATRRAAVSAAVWRVVAARGFAGLSVRTVAAELGASTSAVTHYFASKQELTRHALALLGEEAAQRPRPPAAAGLEALRAALIDLLPVGEEAVQANRVWVSSWDAALADPEVRRDHATRYARGRARLEEHVRDAQERSELGAGDPAGLAAELHAVVLGLVVQALLDPAAFPAGAQRALVEQHLGRLASPGPSVVASPAGELPGRRRRC